MSMSKSLRYFVASQVALYGSLLICIIISPKSLVVNQGLSYFGNFPATIIPYALGFVLTACLAVAAGRMLASGPNTGAVRWGLYVFALGALGILATPSLSVTWISLTHEWIGAGLFFLQLILCTWLVLYVKRDLLNGALLLIQLTAGLAAAFYLNPPTGLLMQSQLVFQVMFGLIIWRSYSAIEGATAKQVSSARSAAA